MLTFNTRINGKTYYIRVAVSYVGFFALALLCGFLPEESMLQVVGYITLILFVLAWQVFLISQMRQRANDIGTHPLLITLLAFLTPFFLVLGLIPGQKKANKYGAQPQ